MPSLSYFKKQAKKLLYNNWITCIGAFFTVAVCFTALTLAASSMISIAASYTNQIVFVFVTVLSGMLLAGLTVPLLYGISVFVYNSVNTGKAEITDLFYAFSSINRYLRSFSLLIAVFWRFVIVFAIPIVLCEEFYLYTIGANEYIATVSFYGIDLTYTVLCITVFIAFMYSLAFFTRYFTAIYLAVERENIPVSQCFFAASVYNYRIKIRMFVLMISFLPLIAVSLLSFGLLFIVYTIPVILFAFFALISHRISLDKMNAELCNEVFEQNFYIQE